MFNKHSYSIHFRDSLLSVSTIKSHNNDLKHYRHPFTYKLCLLTAIIPSIAIYLFKEVISFDSMFKYHPC